MEEHPTLLEIVTKTIVTHTLTYFLMGLLAFVVLDYAGFYSGTDLKHLMRQTSDPMVMAGPLFQPIRGALFGIVFYLLRETFFKKKDGWLTLWFVLVAVGIIGTFGPAPGSFEGMIYTILPLWVHLKGLPEVILQTLFLSMVLFYWINNREKRWLNWVMGVPFVLGLLMPALGLLVGQRK